MMKSRVGVVCDFVEPLHSNSCASYERVKAPTEVVETELSEKLLPNVLHKADRTSLSACYSVFRTLGVKTITNRASAELSPAAAEGRTNGTQERKKRKPNDA